MPTMETKLREHLINETQYDREKWQHTSEENEKLLKALRESRMALEESTRQNEALSQHYCPHHHVQPIEINQHIIIEENPQLVMPSDQDHLRSNFPLCMYRFQLLGYLEKRTSADPVS